MSELENKAQEQEFKRRPYNLREKKTKDAAYRSLIRPELADELYDKILNIIVVQKKYRDSDFSAKDLAKELQTNTRYLSAVVNSRFGMNYSCLLNEYRVKEAMHLLTDKRYADKNVEEISTMVVPTASLSMPLSTRMWGKRLTDTVRGMLNVRNNLLP